VGWAGIPLASGIRVHSNGETVTVTVAKSVASGGSADKGPAGPFYAGDSDRARTLRTGTSLPSACPGRPVVPTV
jgi:hypothetical protein